MKQFPRLALTISLLTLALAGCDSGGNSIAEVNGKTVTQERFDAYLKLKRVPAQNAEWVNRELDDYLEREGLAGQIEEQGLLPVDQVEAEVSEFRKQMLISRYFEEYLRERVTDEAVRNFYATNPDQFQAKKVHVAHILLRTNPAMSDAERQALLTKAQEVYSRANAQEDFTALAKEFSEDLLSAQQGGDLGWLQEGAIDPTFSSKVFAMKAGELSEPLVTPFGFHVIKVIEGPQVIKQPFEAVSGDIRYRLRQEAKQAELDRLKQAAKIEKKTQPEKTEVQAGDESAKG
ncbi:MULTISPECIES: peptidylprolyl isomerase [unclassified Pseudomonas]|uniref:peptidylprolyl isomerase n=1 Tax=unclassified Pseudomonas TaxID=196821 RepID=UPI0024499354|nr:MULTISPECIES: peptidylprolyl isomerase [unclassified Pseudomonas]MDG9925150.1 peptidylprolyl isomerase [Pseudomonas sp. GD04045]MDH0035280.1 peptidylprolyl isomerase [Pseudomonas sp. GD04019]